MYLNLKQHTNDHTFIQQAPLIKHLKHVCFKIIASPRT